MLRNWISILLIPLLCIGHCLAQEEESTFEQQLESLGDAGEAAVEDDSWLQQLEQFRQHRINLNTTSADELRLLMILNEAQIQNLLRYLFLLGRLESIYELQAIPGWDIRTIKKILPFVNINETEGIASLSKRFIDGEHMLQLRAAQTLEKGKAFQNQTANAYQGSSYGLLMRYKYHYKNLLQYGFTGDKDAGEGFFRGVQKYGFDFYSFQLFVRKLRLLKALAIGDYSISMGQGLIQWQGMAFKKSADAMAIKRQSPVLRPYSSSDEYDFLRGIGFTLQKQRWELTAFASSKKITASIGVDSAGNNWQISSINGTGLHRTKKEAADKNNTGLLSGGLNTSYSAGPFHAGLNIVYHRFSRPINKVDEPYNLYAMHGREMLNASIDYSYTWRNMHLFGEAAIDKNKSLAILSGLMMSLHERADLAVLYRNISPSYQSLFGNAFTENSLPVNERGLYFGLSLKPVHGLLLNLYADLFSFPWLKFNIDLPSGGIESFVQLEYALSRHSKIYSRFKFERKGINAEDTGTSIPFVRSLPKNSWRLHWDLQTTKRLAFASRLEILWLDPKKNYQQNGFLFFAEGKYKTDAGNFGASIRLQHFETDGYASRLYAYESDLLYSSAVPAFFDRGFRYYFLTHFRKKNFLKTLVDKGMQMDLWCKWAQTIFDKSTSDEPGLESTMASHKSDIRIQLVISF